MAKQKMVQVPVERLAEWVDIALHLSTECVGTSVDGLTTYLYMSIMAPLPAEGYKMLGKLKPKQYEKYPWTTASKSPGQKSRKNGGK